jgi:hypothetical protein
MTQSIAPESMKSEFAYDLAAERLRRATLWAGLVLALVPFLPFEMVGQSPVFLWDILDELGAAATVAALAPAVLGLSIIVLGRHVRRPSMLSFCILLGLVALAALSWLGADAAAWDITRLPDSMTHRSHTALLSVALAAAAIRLRADTRKVSLGLTLFAAASGLMYALWPTRGELPIAVFGQFAASLGGLRDFRFLLGHGMLLVLVMWPLLSVGIAAGFATRQASTGAPLVSSIVAFAIPVCVVLVSFRIALLTYGDTSAVILAAVGATLAALLTLLSRSAEVTSLHWVGLSAHSDLESGPRPRKAVAAAIGLVVMLLGMQAWLSRPPPKGVHWPIDAKRAEADRLFAELIPRWATARAAWAVQSEQDRGAEQLAETRAAARAISDAALGLNAGIHHALSELVRQSKRLDLAGRRWFRLIESVNEASRNARQPYYLDPVLLVRTQGNQIQRLFLAQPYRIERVVPAWAGGREYSLLRVHQLGEGRASHQRLGFSRDVQAFALVDVDEVEADVNLIEKLAAHNPPTCLDVEAPSELLVKCGELAKMLHPNAEAVLAITQRHELQHQIDGPHLPQASAVLDEMRQYTDEAATEVNRELSAYLAELTANESSPKIGLVKTLPFTYTKATTGLYHIGWLQYEALAGRRLRNDDREQSFRQLTSLFERLTKMPDAELSKLARNAHRRLFGGTLDDVTVGHR